MTLLLQTTTQLVLSMVRYDDRGRYRCIADNMHTNPVLSQYTDIRVTRKPKYLLFARELLLLYYFHIN